MSSEGQSHSGEFPAMKNAGGDSGEGCVCRQAGFGTALIRSRQVTRECKTVPLYGLRSGHTWDLSSDSRPGGELKLQTHPSRAGAAPLQCLESGYAPYTNVNQRQDCAFASMLNPVF